MNDKTTPVPKPEPEILTRFKKHTAAHEMEVILDQGMHRHLRFARPGTGIYHFHIVTWPGYLAISGDMGASIFSRLPDMFEFFRTPDHLHAGAHGLYINRGYWCEKLVANDGAPRRFDERLIEGFLRNDFDAYMEFQDLEEIPRGQELAAALWEQIKQDVRGEDVGDVIESAEDFVPDEDEAHGQAFSDFRFTDMWDSASRLEDYTFDITWRLYAVSHAVRTYDAWKQTQAAAAEVAGA
ncbi:hypothetical protein [Pseudoxanthomonas winnipegensis]|uniref:hypothetical protein n=1 Tax=Pseudoxanthomonas winnipegensis TaxID=2480810 RepID=UPI001F3BEFC9|nr:hypothetical protein [Pseudoxanthomonas winnipegensis]